jgi:membrane fusion protein, multidrug efflux system
MELRPISLSKSEQNPRYWRLRNNTLKRLFHRRHRMFQFSPLPPVRLMLLAVACLGFAACGKRQEASRKPTSAASYLVDVVTVAPQPFRETLFATGSLLARESVQLQSERAGIVREISFDEGRPMKAGDILLAIDDSELRAQLDRAKAQLELASAAENRQRDLLKSRGISAAEYDQSIANLNIAKAEVALIESQLAKTKIRAPFDGVAGLRRVSVGTYLTPGTNICSFQDISSLKIDFSLPEVYLAYLKTGQTVSFRIGGRSDKYEATIIAIEPTVEVATRSLLVRATVPNDEARLLPGSFAEVEVMLGEIPEAILIPAIALIPGLKQQTVFVHREGKVEERKVQAGLRTADSVQIIEGLKAGDELITSGVLQLRPGMPVQVKRSIKADQARKPATPIPVATGGPRE